MVPELALCPLPDIKASQEPVPGPTSGHSSSLAAEHNMWIVVGMSEASFDPRLPYSTLVVLGPHDEVLKYRKTHLDYGIGDGGFIESRLFTAGNVLYTVDVKGWRVGLNAGGEDEIPEVPCVLSLQGAQIILSCNADTSVGTEADVASASDVAVVVVSNHVGHNGVVKGEGTARIHTPPQGLWAKPVTVPEAKAGWVAKVFRYSDMARWRNLPVLGRCPTIDPRSRRPELYQVTSARRPTQ